MTIRNQRAFAAGALFVVVAIAFLFMSRDYELGTAARMGPGYFPVMLALVLAGIGLVIMANAVLPGAAVEKLARWDWKGLAWIAGSVVLFAIALRPLGFVLSLFLLVVFCSRASSEFTWRGALFAAAILTALCVGIFHFGIDLRLPLWPAFVSGH
jgi:hypothetical protein